MKQSLNCHVWVNLARIMNKRKVRLGLVGRGHKLEGLASNYGREECEIAPAQLPWWLLSPKIQGLACHTIRP